MSKAQFFLLSISMMLFSCGQKKTKPTTETSGKINTISVIVDDELWNGEIGDSIRNKFASPVLGLPQEEPVFSLNQYPVKLLEGFMTNNRNIIVIKKEAKSEFRIKDNEFANPQIIVHISGRNNQEILDSIQANDSLIIQKIKKSEIKILQKQIAEDSVIDTKNITSKFKIKVNIPNKYKLAICGKKFMWFKKEIISGSLSLLFYQIPIYSIKDNPNMIKRITKIRDSIGNIYIHGAVPKTKMITEPAFSPYLSKTKIFGRETFETRGTWEIQRESMSGPFVNYVIFDTTNNRILVVEGFCYAPSKQKRDLMFELEAIIKSIQFLKK